MSFLLDTNVLFELRKGPRCHPGLAGWARAQPHSSLFTSVMVVGEIRKGIELRRRHDAAHARALELWLEQVCMAFAGRILPVDRAVAEEWGRLNAPDPLPVVDGLLAATARVHGMTFVSRDAAVRSRLGVRQFDPFAAR